MTWLEFIAAIATAALASTGLWGAMKAGKSDTRQAVHPKQVSEADKQAHLNAEQTRQVQRVDTLWDLFHHLREEVEELRAQVQRSRQEVDEARAETGLVHAHVLELRDTLDDPPPWPPGYPPHLPREIPTPTVGVPACHALEH